MPANILPSYCVVMPIEGVELADYERAEFGHIVVKDNMFRFECDLVIKVHGQADVTSFIAWLDNTKLARRGRFVTFIEPSMTNSSLCQIIDTVKIKTRDGNTLNINYSNYIEVTLRIQVMA
jgi:CRISPR/Cas system CMR-associated protein Cmr3 (group 5 of RAMP superfamily)